MARPNPNPESPDPPKSVSAAEIEAMSEGQLNDCLAHGDIDGDTIRACLRDPRAKPKAAIEARVRNGDLTALKAISGLPDLNAGQLYTVARLVSKGIQISMETNGGSYLDALQAVSLHGCQKILEYLREKNHQAPETWHKTWQRCLFEVLSEDLDYPMEEIVLLLKGKNLVDVTLLDEDGLTLLYFAVKH